MIPSLNYFAKDSAPNVLRASADTCACANCCQNQCGKRECAQYVGTAAGKNCILVCNAKPIVQEVEAVQYQQQFGGW